MKQFKTIIVDDERLARNEIRSLVAEYPEIKIVGEADCLSKAIELIHKYDPDVVFLDIQLPGESGFGLLEHIGSDMQIIFVTAYDEYAIRAFEVNALDYLLKPVNPKRLKNTIERLIKSQKKDEISKQKLEYDDSIFIRQRHSLKMIKIKNLVTISAEGEYSRIIDSFGNEGIVLKSLKEWEMRLPEKYFRRIHRSTIVNFEYIDKMEKWFNHSYRIYIRNIKEPLIMSRRYTAKLKEKFGL